MFRRACSCSRRPTRTSAKARSTSYGHADADRVPVHRAGEAGPGQPRTPAEPRDRGRDRRGPGDGGPAQAQLDLLGPGRARRRSRRQKRRWRRPRRRASRRRQPGRHRAARALRRHAGSDRCGRASRSARGAGGRDRRPHGWQVETDDLSELDIVRVQDGQTVAVTFDAIPGLRRPARRPCPAQGEKKLGDMTYTAIVRLEPRPASALEHDRSDRPALRFTTETRRARSFLHSSVLSVSTGTFGRAASTARF